MPALPRPSLPSFALPSLPKLQFKKAERADPKPAAAKPKRLVLAGADDGGPAPDAPEVETELADEMAMADAVGPDEVEEAPEPRAETDVEEAEPEAGPKRDLSKIKVRLARQNAPKQTAPPPPALDEYELPDWSVLAEPETGFAEQQEEYVREKAAQLEEAFEEFGVDAHVEAIETGPVITMYEISVAKGDQGRPGQRPLERPGPHPRRREHPHRRADPRKKHDRHRGPPTRKRRRSA